MRSARPFLSSKWTGSRSMKSKGMVKFSVPNAQRRLASTSSTEHSALAVGGSLLASRSTSLSKRLSDN